MLIFNALQVVRVTQGAKLFKVVIARPRQSSPPYCHCEDEARGRSNLLISTVIARTRHEDEAIFSLVLSLRGRGTRTKQSTPLYCHCEAEVRGRSNLPLCTVIARTRYEDEAIYQSNDCPIIPTVDCFVTLKQHSSFQELNHFPFLAMTVLMEEDEERGRSNLPIE